MDLNSEKINKMMTFRRKGKIIIPLFVTPVNDEYILAAYQGLFSEYDILIKYRQKIDCKWSRLRTPKHIHWAVDILIKMHSEKDKTKEFLDFLLETWENTIPIKSEAERQEVLSINALVKSNKEVFDKYDDLSKQGEYSVKFLVLLAKLLMVQEKTNLETAYMFKELIEALKSDKSIFKIVSIATHGRKK